ncbi:MAG: hypothetical protein M3T49_00625 [Candidatus Eremiobacteraeota bacterium]|nr:hypothetical protein [Candidatus Eremiobacteraeota bacterium]
MLAEQIRDLLVGAAIEQQTQSDFKERALAQALFKGQSSCPFPHIS